MTIELALLPASVVLGIVHIIVMSRIRAACASPAMKSPQASVSLLMVR